MAQIKGTEVSRSTSKIQPVSGVVSRPSTSSFNEEEQRRFYRAYMSNQLDDSKITNDGWKSIYEYELKRGTRQPSDIDTTTARRYNIDLSLGTSKQPDIDFEISKPTVEPEIEKTSLFDRFKSIFKTSDQPVNPDIEKLNRTNAIQPGFGNTLNGVKPSFGDIDTKKIASRDPLLMALTGKSDVGMMPQQTSDFLNGMHKESFKNQQDAKDILSGLKGMGSVDMPGGNLPRNPVTYAQEQTYSDKQRSNDEKISGFLHSFGREFVGKASDMSMELPNQMNKNFADAIAKKDPEKAKIINTTYNKNGQPLEYWNEDKLYNAFLGRPHDNAIPEGEQGIRAVGSFAGNLGKIITFSKALGMPSTAKGLLAKNVALGTASGLDTANINDYDAEETLKEAVIGAMSFGAGELAGIGITNKLGKSLVHVYKANPTWANGLNSLVLTARGMGDGTVGGMVHGLTSTALGRETQDVMKQSIQSGLIMAIVSGVTSFVPWSKFGAYTEEDIRKYNISVDPVDEPTLRNGGFTKLSEVEGVNKNNPYVEDIWINPTTKEIKLVGVTQNGMIVPKSLVENKLDTDLIDIVRQVENTRIKTDVDLTKQIDYIDKTKNPKKYLSVMDDFMSRNGFKKDVVNGESFYDKVIRNPDSPLESTIERLTKTEAENFFEDNYFTKTKTTKPIGAVEGIENRTTKSTVADFDDSFEVNRAMTDTTQRAWVRDMQDKGYKEFKPGVWVKEVDGKITDVVPEFTADNQGRPIPVYGTRGVSTEKTTIKGVTGAEYETATKPRAKNPNIEHDGIKDFAEAELKGVNNSDKETYETFLRNLKGVDQAEAKLNEVYKTDADVDKAIKDIKDFNSLPKVKEILNFFEGITEDATPEEITQKMTEFNDEHDRFFNEIEDIDEEIMKGDVESLILEDEQKPASQELDTEVSATVVDQSVDKETISSPQGTQEPQIDAELDATVTSRFGAYEGTKEQIIDDFAKKLNSKTPKITYEEFSQVAENRIKQIENKDFEELTEVMNTGNKNSVEILSKYVGKKLTTNKAITEAIRSLDPEAYDKWSGERHETFKAESEAKNLNDKTEKDDAKRQEWLDKGQSVKAKYKGAVYTLDELVSKSYEDGYRLKQTNEYGGYEWVDMEGNRLNYNDHSKLAKKFIREKYNDIINREMEEEYKADQDEYEKMSEAEREQLGDFLGGKDVSFIGGDKKTEEDSEEIKGEETGHEETTVTDESTVKTYEVGDKVSFTGANGEVLKGTIRSTGDGDEVSINVTTGAKSPGGVPIKRVEFANVKDLEKLVETEEVTDYESFFNDTASKVDRQFEDKAIIEYLKSGNMADSFIERNIRSQIDRIIPKIIDNLDATHIEKLMTNEQLNRMAKVIRDRLQEYIDKEAIKDGEQTETETTKPVKQEYSLERDIENLKNQMLDRMEKITDLNQMLESFDELGGTVIENLEMVMDNAEDIYNMYYAGKHEGSTDDFYADMFDSDDPEIRKQAQKNMEQIKRFIDRFKGSVIELMEYTKKQEVKPKAEETTGNNIGYHAGTLDSNSKPESFFNMTSSNRSTGHFGTGTYFVGDKSKLEGSYEGKPVHEISFEGYNLYRPDNYSVADKVHEALKFVNNYFSNIDKVELARKGDEYYQKLEELNEAVEDAYIGGLGDEMEKTSNALIEFVEESGLFYSHEIDELADYKGDMENYGWRALVKLEAKNKYNGNLGKLVSNFDSFAEDVLSLPDMTVEKAVETIKQVKDKVTKDLGVKFHDSYDKSKHYDSPSTIFMKALGYDGVDVRHIPRMDNTQYGSVIYDIKEKGINKPTEELKTVIEEESFLPDMNVFNRPSGVNASKLKTLRFLETTEGVEEFFKEEDGVNGIMVDLHVEYVFGDDGTSSRSWDTVKDVVQAKRSGDLNIVRDYKTAFEMRYNLIVDKENDLERTFSGYAYKYIDLLKGYYKRATLNSDNTVTVRLINPIDAESFEVDTSPGVESASLSAELLYDYFKKHEGDTNKASETVEETELEETQAVTLEDYGLKVEMSKTANGINVWNVSGDTKEYKDILGKNGLKGRWYGPEKVWSFSAKMYPTKQSLEEALLNKINPDMAEVGEVVKASVKTTQEPQMDAETIPGVPENIFNQAIDYVMDNAPDEWHKTLLKQRGMKININKITDKQKWTDAIFDYMLKTPERQGGEAWVDLTKPKSTTTESTGPIDITDEFFGALSGKKPVSELDVKINGTKETVVDDKPTVFMRDLIRELEDEITDIVSYKTYKELLSDLEFQLGDVANIDTNKNQYDFIENAVIFRIGKEKSSEVFKLILDGIRDRIKPKTTAKAPETKVETTESTLEYETVLGAIKDELDEQFGDFAYDLLIEVEYYEDLSETLADTYGKAVKFREEMQEAMEDVNDGNLVFDMIQKYVEAQKEGVDSGQDVEGTLEQGNDGRSDGSRGGIRDNSTDGSDNNGSIGTGSTSGILADAGQTTGETNLQQGVGSRKSESTDTGHDTGTGQTEGQDGTRASDDNNDNVVGEQGEDEGSPIRNTTVSIDTGEETRTEQNYEITQDGDIFLRGGKVARFESNIKALRTLLEIMKDDRTATPEEKKALAGYSGWGAVQEAFDYRKDDWKQRYTDLMDVTRELDKVIPKRSGEYRDIHENMSRSSQNAHFTDPRIIKEIYNALKQMGFKGGSILEPSMGSGYFFGMMPRDIMRKSRLYGVELDSVTGHIAKYLYPNADIRVTGFENTIYPNNFFDVVVGNVPFGSNGVIDKDYPKDLTNRIHNYFFAKTIDKTKPGGIMMIITSTGTMDTMGAESVRDYLSDRANLIGAIRLPSDAFKDIAGTEVTTDILILQKLKDGEIPDDKSWVKTGGITLNDKYMTINKYFENNPNMMIGELTEDTLRGNRIALVNKEGNTYGKLSELIKETVPVGIFNAKKSKSPTIMVDNEEMNRILTDELEGSVIEKEGKYYRKIDGKAHLIKDNLPQIKEIHNLKTLANKLMRMQRVVDVDVVDMEKTRKELKTAYEGYVKKHGNLHKKTKTKGNFTGLTAIEKDFGYTKEIKDAKGKAKPVFYTEPSVYLLKSLEIEKVVTDEKGNKSQVITPSLLLTQRTNKPPTPKDKVDTAQEGLLTSINFKGYVDMDYISQIYGKSVEEVEKELKGKVYHNPATGGYETSDEYLSGNVKFKLKTAMEHALYDSKYDYHVEELKKAQPKEMKYKDIVVRTGDGWVPYHITQKVVTDFLGLRYVDAIKLEYDNYGASWNVSQGNKSNYRFTPEMQKMTNGIPNKEALGIIKIALNNSDTTVTVKGSDGKKYKDMVQTKLLEARVKEIRGHINKILKEHPEYQIEVEEAFNEKINNTVIRDYNEIAKTFTFPSMNPNVELRENQKVGITRALLGGNTLLAHGVGSGKTFELIAIAIESKRMGISNKPVIVVPNNKLSDFENDANLLYPGANILALGESDFNGENIKNTLALAGTNDWDAVIIRHSSFTKIPVSAETQYPILFDELSELKEALYEAQTNGGARYTIKQIENLIEKYELKMKEMLESKTASEYDMLTFEEIGFDYILVDEAHSFKNLQLAGRFSNIKGVHTSDSAKATDMMIKTKYVSSLHGGKSGVVFGTGTPISNSMAEVYAMFKYLRPDLLRDSGIRSFDAWVNTFAQVEGQPEIKATGEIKVVEKFTDFVNLFPLFTKFREFTDVVFTDELDYLKLPKYEVIKVECPENPRLAEISTIIRDEWEEASKSGQVFKYFNMMKQAPQDIRFVFEDGVNHEGSKANMVTQNVYDIWKDKKKEKATQLIFMFRMQSNSTGFNLGKDIRATLIEKGIPENEIVFITGETKESELEDIFEKINSGKIRVAIGSYEKMGVGLNVQNKLFAIHEIDVPHRPIDIEQAEGRIIRDGNSFYGKDTVKIFRYVTVKEDRDSFSGDAYSWQLVEYKLNNIRAIMKGEMVTAFSEDSDQMAMLISSALNDERYFALREYEKTSVDLGIERDSFVSNQFMAKHHIDTNYKRKRDYDYKISSLEGILNRVSGKEDSKDIVTFDDEVMNFADSKARAEINKKFSKQIVDKTTNSMKQQIYLGEYKGLYYYYTNESYETKQLQYIGEEKIEVKDRKMGYATTLYTVYENRYSTKSDQSFKDKKFDYIRQFNNINRIPADIEKMKEQIEIMKQDNIKYEAQSKGDYDKEHEYLYAKAMFHAIDYSMGLSGEATIRNGNLGKVQVELNRGFTAISYFTAKNKADEEKVIESTLRLVKLRSEASSLSEGHLEEYLEAYVDVAEEIIKEFGYDENKLLESKKAKPKQEAMKSKNRKYNMVEDSGEKVEQEQTVTNRKVKPKPMSEIIKDIQKEFGTSVSNKRYSGPKKSSGFYDTHSGSIRTRKAQDIKTITHELGHHLDNKYGFSKDHMEELVDMSTKLTLSSDYSKEEIPGEAFAEFIRLYITTEEEAYELSPDFYDTFMETISKEDMKKLTKIKTDTLNWMLADVLDQIESTMVSHTDKKRTSVEEMKVKFVMNVFDDIHPILELTETAERFTGQKIQPSDNPYILAFQSRKAGMIAMSQVLHAQSDIEGNVIGNPLSSIINEIDTEDRNAFEQYLKVSHAITLYDFGKQVFPEEIDIDKQKFAKEQLERRNPNFKVTAEKLYEWWNVFIEEWVVKAGFMSKDTFERMREMYPTYVPNFRAVDRQGRRNSHAKDGFGNQQSPIKRMTGSDLDTYKPIESMLLYIDKIVKTQKRNEVGQAVHRLYSNVQGLGNVLTRITPEKAYNRFDATNIKETLTNKLMKDYAKNLKGEDKKHFNELVDAGDYEGMIKYLTGKGFAGVEIVDNTMDDIIEFFTPKTFSTDSNVYTVVDKNGATYFYEVHDKYFMEAMLNLGKKDLDGVVKAMGTAKRVFTNLTTGANPIFGLFTNIWSDIPEAWAYGSYKNPFEMGVELAKGFKEVAVHRSGSRLSTQEAQVNSNLTQYRVMGGGMASPISEQRRLMNEMLNKLFPDRKKSSLKFVADWGISLIENFNETLETAPRLTEYNKLIKEMGDSYEGRLMAMYMSNEVTMNFQRHGKLNNTFIGQAVPFLNAGLQGMYKLNNEFIRMKGIGKNDITGDGDGGFKSKRDKSQFVEMMLKIFVGITMFEIAQMIAYKDDEDFDKLSEYIKDNYWLIKTDDGKFIRIRKSRELGLLFGSGFRRGFMSVFEGDDDAWYGFGESFFNAILPPNPATDNIFAPMVSVISNKAWHGGDIVPLRLQGRSAPLQYDASTTEISKVVSKVLDESLGVGISPMHMDYVVQQYSGFIGQVMFPALSNTDTVLESFGRRMVSDVRYSNNVSSKFYDRKEELDDAYKDYNDLGILKEGFDFVERYRYYKVGQEMTDLYSQIRDIDNSNMTREEKKKAEEVVRERMLVVADEKNLIPTSYDEFKVLYNRGQDLTSKYKKQFEDTGVRGDMTDNERVLLELYNNASKGGKSKLAQVNYDLSQMDKRIKQVEASTLSEQQKRTAIDKLETTKVQYTDKFMNYYRENINIDINDFFQ